MENMIVTQEMEHALDIIENDKDCSVLFITGKAGTGKSVFLQHIKTKLRNAAVVAPTGVAAMNVSGVTVHSFFKFNIGFLDRNKVSKARNTEVYEKLQYLIMDEISMVRADMYDSINKYLQKNRNRKDKAFGGVKLIIFGDLCQLPPVVTNEDAKILEHYKYDTPYFFSSKIFSALRTSFRYIEFTRIFRQSDRRFKELLQAVRTNTVTKEDYDDLNACVVTTEQMKQMPESTMLLCTTNQKANDYNKHFLSVIPEKLHTYYAETNGTLKPSEYPTLDVLELKIDAQVLFIKNDPEGRWVNGSIGHINKCHNDYIEVELKDGSVVDVEPVCWNKIDYKIKDDELISEKIGSFTQLPIKLGWAITIHKSQGLSFDDVFIDTGSGIFAAGQLYVALSRCRTLEGIRLKKPIRPQDMIVNKELAKFNKRLVELTSQQNLL